jgi:biotin synthase
MKVIDLLNKDKLNKDDIVKLLSLKNDDEIELLCNRAFEVKQQYFGNKIHLRGIIEFSNFCRQDCFYCGIRNENEEVIRYRMSCDEILKCASMIYSAGIKTIVLQSGEDLHYTSEDIAKIIREIKNKFDVAITLSLGERTFDEYKVWKEAGADRYLLKHETANPDIYFDIHPYQNFEDRIEHLKYLKKIGYQLGSGNIIGLPGQTIDDIADDIILCSDLDVDMASFSPFISAENTPFSNIPNCDIGLAIKTIAAARIYLKNVHIPATTALSTISPDGRKKGLLAGANVVMPTFTPNDYRFNYLIYKNKPGGSEDPKIKLKILKKLFKEIGVESSGSLGHSLKLTK